MFHNSLNVAVRKNASPSRRARACPSPCVWLAALIPPVVQDLQILPRSGSGKPELHSRKCWKDSVIASSAAFLKRISAPKRARFLNHRAAYPLGKGNFPSTFWKMQKKLTFPFIYRIINNEKRTRVLACFRRTCARKNARFESRLALGF